MLLLVPFSARSCEEFPEYAPDALPFTAQAGFESETLEHCNQGIIPVGQKAIVVNYNLLYKTTPGILPIITFTLYVKVNGTVVHTIANQVQLSDALFVGVAPVCNEDPQNPGCIYSKNFETYVDISSFAINQPAELQVFAAASTSDQSHHSGVHLQGSILHNFRFVLQQTNYSFQPRDSRDSVSLCGEIQHYESCYPRFPAFFMQIDPTLPQAGIYYFPVEPNARIRYRLTFPKPHLRGTSSNNGDGMEPDYTIDPRPSHSDGMQYSEFVQQDEQQATQSDGSYMVATIPLEGPLPSASVVISSNDFGGRARVFAEVIFGPPGNEIVIAAEVGETIAEIFAPAPVPSCLTGQILPFATLPIDQDCDDLADSWEAEHGGISSSDYDEEPGPGGPHVGDGYTAHDEYRGFHFLTTDSQNATSVTWDRTDPKQAKDAFYWDASVLGMDSNMRSILGHQGPSLMIRQVDDSQAGSNGIVDVTQQWVLPLAKNTIHQSPRNAFALVYVSHTFSASLAPDIIANSQVFRMSGRPILYDVQRVTGVAQTMGFNLDFLLSFTFAHEAGHQFGLYHPERFGCGAGFSCSPVNLPSPPTFLGLNEFSPNPSNNLQLYLKIKYYADPNPAMQRSWPEHKGYLMFGGQAYDGAVTPAVYPDTSGAMLHIDLLTFSHFTPITSASVVRVFEAINSLMDWTPSLLHVNPLFIKFNQDQSNSICLHSGCAL